MDDDFMALRRESEEKIKKGEYDVFISYNSKDEEQVKEIYNLLKDNGIAPWFDKWDLRPGFPWQPEIVQQIRRSKAVAVFISEAGFGPWHDREAQLALDQQGREKKPVMAVLLPGAKGDELDSSFLPINTRVDFRKSDPDPLERLIFGITGQRGVKPLRPFVLIASLGESPAVVPAMYHLLREREGLTIGRACVLYPEEEEEEEGKTGHAYEMVREALQELARAGRVEGRPLHFKDANSWKNACKFLKDLFLLLEACQDAGERVCLSLAGGRKSMSALMAWVVPFFPCIKKLYAEGLIFIL